MIVFGHFQNGNYHWTGFKETAQHMVNCSRCMSIETGEIVAGELTHHTAVLLTRSDARKQAEMGENVVLAGPVSQDTTVTGQTGLPGPSSTAVDSLPPTRTGAMRGILVKFSSIGSYTRALTTLIMRAKKDEVGPTLIK